MEERIFFLENKKNTLRQKGSKFPTYIREKHFCNFLPDAFKSESKSSPTIGISRTEIKLYHLNHLTRIPGDINPN